MFNNIEEFLLNDDSYKYKSEFMKNKGLVKWYNYNQKNYFFPEKS